MSQLPDDAVAYRASPLFSGDDVPAAMTQSHTTRAGVWGRLEVRQGSLRYHVLEGEHTGVYVLTPGVPGIIAPTVPHRVEIVDPTVQFQIVFLRPADEPSP